MPNITRTAKGYWHDLDPYTRHATKAAAQKARSKMLGLQKTHPKIKRRKARVSTFYTFLQDKRKKALKGKGESSTKPVDMQIDLPAKHGFNDVKTVQARNASLLKTVKAFGVK